MKLNILATGQSPDYYSITGDVITAHVGAQSDSYDLSVLAEGDSVTDVSAIGDIKPIRHATRVNGELQVTLCQRVGPGHWSESGWFDAFFYDPDAVYAVLDETKTFSGTPVAYTRQGPIEMEVS